MANGKDEKSWLGSLKLEFRNREAGFGLVAEGVLGVMGVMVAALAILAMSHWTAGAEIVRRLVHL